MSEDRPLFTWESLEGEFIRWVSILQLDVNAPCVWPASMIVDNHGTVYTQNAVWVPPFHIITRAGVLTTRAGEWFASWRQDRNSSVGNKYVVSQDTLAANPTFKVYRYGAEIFTRALTLDNPLTTIISEQRISPNGRYIAIQCLLNLPPLHEFLFLYEGRETLV